MNGMGDDPGFQKLKVLQPISQYEAFSGVTSMVSSQSPRIMMPDLRRLQEELKPSNTEKGDGQPFNSSTKRGLL